MVILTMASKIANRIVKLMTDQCSPDITAGVSSRAVLNAFRIT